jgi:hypothetical protein
MDSSVSPKDEIWFLRVCHHISNAVYNPLTCNSPSTRTSVHSRRLWQLPACFLFPLYLNHLQLRPSILYVVFLFSIFLPLQLMQSVWVFLGPSYLPHDHTILIRGTSVNFTVSVPSHYALYLLDPLSATSYLSGLAKENFEKSSSLSFIQLNAQPD